MEQVIFMGLTFSFGAGTVLLWERDSIRPLVGEKGHCLRPSQPSLGDFIPICFLHFFFHWAWTDCLSWKHDFPHCCSRLSPFKPYPQKYWFRFASFDYFNTTMKKKKIKWKVFLWPASHFSMFPFEPFLPSVLGIIFKAVELYIFFSKINF